MKKLLLLPALLIIAYTARAQQPKTLVNSDYGSISGFGGFLISIQPIDGNFTSLTGGGGAVLFNNQFYFGGYGMGLAEDIDITIDNIDYNVEYGHGGFMLGYIIRPNDLVHFGISSKLGWGEIYYEEKFVVDNRFVYEDDVFVVHPQAEAEVNVTSWFKFNVGVGYSTALGVDDFYYNENDFNGLAVGVSLLFGWFGN